ncbi:hydroxymethylglutaryl-CoA lyase [Cryomorpha ignava]|uniref:Hydroxymethylglutaryl-CoA lyase n=1 Tax=Cryomorpha ignava TaxID=101383 RepID=A0A7K3WWB5_9FLAO|nr:hydroxymethylglutaryl-CoA lyase [Cryomorpha ignava]NEN25824.1 hydroxymethylglutaryl-CoA lyase [Cryomorpha ignava]
MKELLQMVELIECPRDAMQGIKTEIPTETKINYINALLKVGFDTIDFGSFVSPKAVPQMSDTIKVLEGLDLSNTNSKLLAIIANTRGAADACAYEQVDYLGYPFSISETFQQRNTNASIEESLKRVEEIKNLTDKHHKKLVVYISMAFGNPYGDPWHPDIAADWASRLHRDLGIEILALSDTIGTSDSASITNLFSTLIPELPNVTFGAHLHTTPSSWKEKIDAAYMAGCRRFDGAIKGFGGCPMAADDLTGNMATENILWYLDEVNVKTKVDKVLFARAMAIAETVFP